MKIILLKDIAKIGKRYDTKDVSDGYALNMLIPKGLAVASTAETAKRIALEKARLQGEEKVHNDLVLKNLEEIDGKNIKIKEKTNDKGHLFAGVHQSEIASAIEKELRLKFNPENIIIDKPIKEVGTYELEVKAGDKSSKFNLEIESK